MHSPPKRRNAARSGERGGASKEVFKEGRCNKAEVKSSRRDLQRALYRFDPEAACTVAAFCALYRADPFAAECLADAAVIERQWLEAERLDYVFDRRAA